MVCVLPGLDELRKDYFRTEQIETRGRHFLQNGILGLGVADSQKITRECIEQNLAIPLDLVAHLIDESRIGIRE